MRARLLIICALLFLYLYSFPYFSGLRSANELPRIFLTTELVDHGTARINRRVGELGSTFDVATTPDGGKYSNKAPGLSFLAVPGYLLVKAYHAVAGDSPTLGELTWVFRVTAVTLPSLAFLPFFLAFARRFAPHTEAPPRTALVALSLGSMALPYGILFFSHQIGAACAGASFIAATTLVRDPVERRNRWAAAAGGFAGLAVLIDYQAALAGLFIGAYLLLRSPRRWRDAAIAAAAAAPSALALALYHWACFGSPLTTGYSFAADPAHQRGVLGIIGPNREAMYNALLAPDNGLLTLMPWTALAAVGAIAIARSRELRERIGAEALVCGLIAIAYILFVGSLVPEFGRAGWSVGPRYIAVAVPFLAWLATAGFELADRSRLGRVLALATVWVGVIIFVTATATYPHWPTPNFRNPLYEVDFRLIAAGMAPHSLGTWLGLPGWLAHAALFAVAAALTGWLLAGRHRTRWMTAGGAALVAALWIGAYSLFPRGAPTAERGWRYIERTWEP